MKRGRRLAQTRRGRVQQRWPVWSLWPRRIQTGSFLYGEFERWLLQQAQLPQVLPIIHYTTDTRPVAERWRGYDRFPTCSSVEKYGMTTRPLDIRDIKFDNAGTTARKGGR